MSHGEAETLRLRVRSLEGVRARLTKQCDRLRQENAQLKLKCENRDLLLAVVRQVCTNGEALQELLDRRKEEIKVSEVTSPYIKYPKV